jgi:hypothetical protein
MTTTTHTDRTSEIDTQAVEVIGRCKIIELLFRARVEVARPERDHGVDLIAYIDHQKGPQPLIVRPIQLKVASHEQFSIDDKYASITNLIIIFIWHVREVEKCDIYALTHPETLSVVPKSWTHSDAWIKGHYYTQNRPSKELKERLERYRITSPSSLKRKIISLENLKKI